jgi:peptidoglycan/xylan/chitin deacetylase (PgdA/CDA1 family)
LKLKIILLVMLLMLGLSYSYAQYGPVVSFTYDDGHPTWYADGFPAFQEYGFPGVGYLNATHWWITGDYDAVDNLLEMQNAGWEISSHTYDHDTINEWEVSSMKDWLDANGFPNSGFCAPYGIWDHSLVNTVKRYHPYYAANNTTFGGISQPFDLYALKRVGLTNDMSIDTIKAILDDAVANNKWIIFSGHVFGNTPDGWEQSVELLKATFDEIVLRGIPVKTVRDVINDLFPPGCVIECSDSAKQYPVLTAFEEDSLGFGAFNTSAWNEYWHTTFWSDPRYTGSPVVYCHTSNDTLPVMKFYSDVPNGQYEVIASIIEYDADRTYRLYYSFDGDNLSQYNVEVNQNSDVSLGTVTITNGQFALYTQKAEVVSGDDGYVGWAFIKLIPRPLLLNLKVFLEGPYGGSGLMSTTLNTNNLVPLGSNKAYPTTVYGYYTVSNLTSIPNSNIVDWVVIELRTGTGSETKVAQRAVFLKRDGTIVDIDGSSPVTFTGLSEGDYYVVVRHRNHLAIMTASAIPFSSTSAFYDFTTSQSQAYGTNAMKDLGGGVFGMYTGDGNQDGLVTSTDFNVFNPKFTSAVSGYEYSDWNLDGLITSTDFNFFNPNFTTAKQTYVP